LAAVIPAQAGIHRGAGDPLAHRRHPGARRDPV